MASIKQGTSTPSPQPLVLRTIGLSKRYGRILALDNLGLEVTQGEVFGFLGPNGSGKTTTIGIVLGLIAPTAGRVELFGQDITRDLPSLVRRVGVVMENPCLYPDFSGEDNLTIFARVHGGVKKGKIAELLDMVGLAPRAGSKVKTYSQGMKQRLALATALLHDPEFLILDEPTNGMDPEGLAEVRELIRTLASQGKTVLLSSHLLHEVEQVCHRVAVIKQGRVMAQGLVKDLLRRGKQLQIKVTQPQEALTLLRGVDWIVAVRLEEGYLVVEAAEDRAAEVNALLAQKGLYVSELKYRETTLEDFFLEVTQ